MDSAVNLRISQFSEMFFRVKGKPFSLALRPWWQSIYDMYHPDIVIMGGRQIEKSTSIANRMVGESCLSSDMHFVYCSATMNHVRRFVRDRLVSTIYATPFIRKNYTSAPYCKNSERMIVMANRAAIDLVTLRGNGDTVRGIPGDRLFIDEIQDITQEAVSVAIECLSHAGDEEETDAEKEDLGMTFRTGTPKTADNILATTFFNKSTAENWVVPCPSCGKYNILKLNNISREGIICSYCYKKRGAKIRLNTLEGGWAAEYELSETRPLRGFRIPQMLLAAQYTPERYLKFYIKVRNSDKVTLYNEVLGLPYDKSSKPLTKADFSFGDHKIVNAMDIRRTYGPQKYIVGIDWGFGTTFTFLVIGFTLPDGRFKIVYYKKFSHGAELDREWQLAEVKKILTNLNFTIMGTDWGVGHAYQNPNLQRTYGFNRVAEIYNSGTQKRLIKYNKEGKFYTINRDGQLEKLFQDIRDGQILFPNEGDSEAMVEDFMNIRQEFRKNINGDIEPYFTHDEDKPDDGAHALNYGLVAASLIRLWE